MELASTIKNEFIQLFAFKENRRKWQIALLATICIGAPLLMGLYFGNLKNGLTASICGLVILYLPDQGSLTNRLVTILVCSFGFMASYTFGLIFSANSYLSIVALGIFTFLVHWITLYYKAAPPRSFFFILIASLAICQPYQLESLPTKIGLVGLGTLFSCFLALIYLVSLSLRGNADLNPKVVPALEKNPYANSWEAIILGVFISISLGIGKLLDLENPYWIPISCAAVMQGASIYNIWQRSFQRILGTFIGLGICWLILIWKPETWMICLSIILLQFIVEMLVTRQYAIAVIFITPMTILMAEAANPLIHSPETLVALRFWEILIGSLLGALGGYFIHKEKIRYTSIQGLKKLGKGLLK